MQQVPGLVLLLAQAYIHTDSASATTVWAVIGRARGRLVEDLVEVYQFPSPNYSDVVHALHGRARYRLQG